MTSPACAVQFVPGMQSKAVDFAVASGGTVDAGGRIRESARREDRRGGRGQGPMVAPYAVSVPDMA
eukprot:2804407-Rhodomonas_salina.1